jgi:hypothetical protein
VNLQARTLEQAIVEPPVRKDDPAHFYPRRYVSRYARFLVFLAWTIEIIAVLIGFTISIVVSVSAYNSFASTEDVGLLDGGSAILVAGLPFVLVAAVEICKIPLTFAFMAVRNVAWRSLFLFFVIFLCLITFETMLNGFERNFSNLNRAIDDRKNDIENRESQVALLEKRRGQVVRFTEDDLLGEVELARAEVSDDYTRSVQRIDQNASRMISDIDYGFKSELEVEIARLMDVRDEYYRDWSAETAAVEERFSVLLLDNISGSAGERERLLGELQALRLDMDRALLRANFFTRATVENKYRALIRDKEDQLATITTGYLGADAIEKQSTMEAQLKQQLEFVNSKYSGRITEANARIESLKQEIANRLANNAALERNLLSRASADKSRFEQIRNEQNHQIDGYLETKMTELEEITTRSFGIDEQIFALRNDQRMLQTEINHLINQNQIYRLAMYAFGKQSATDVERGMVGIVALVWFGSLSLIAAVCGVMLALAGFYLRRFADEAENPSAA